MYAFCAVGDVVQAVPLRLEAVESVASRQQYPGMTSLPLDHAVDWKSSTRDCLLTPQHSNYRYKLKLACDKSAFKIVAAFVSSPLTKSIY